MSETRQPIINYFGGLDLGQAHDYSALAIIETEVGYKDFDERGHMEDVWLPPETVVLRVSHLERLPRGTPYPEVVEEVVKRMKALPMAGRGSIDGGPPRRVLAVDATGVGRAIIDMLRATDVPIVPITITAGDQVTSEGGYTRVPKRDLVGGLQVLLGKDRLRVAGALPEASTLTNELRNYRYKLTNTAHDTYNAREGEHDDLVLAVGVGAWVALRHLAGGNPSEEIEALDVLNQW